MKKLVVLVLLASLSLAALPARGQNRISVQEHDRQVRKAEKVQRKALKRAEKRQRKEMKKAAKAQRKAMQRSRLRRA